MMLPFFKKRSPAREYYFGLFLKENQGIGYLFAKEDSKLSLLTKQEFRFSNGWENLTNDVDEVLFKMENETKAHAGKMIVFVFSHLVDERTKEIKKPYLQKIKDLTRNLEIKPIGYIECYEAVSFFLSKRDGSPLTSILIELDENNVDVFIYKGGHKVHSSIIARTDDIVGDLHAVFDTLGQTLLPNRIILYNSSNLLEESTKIITHKWSSDLFVQIPRVEILKEGDILKGCMQVFEQQLVEELKEPEQAVSDSPEFVMPEDEEEIRKPEKKQEDVMGFVVGKDVRDVQAEKPTQKESSHLFENEGPDENASDLFTAKKRNGPDFKKMFAGIIGSVRAFPLRRFLVILLPLCAVVGIIVAAEFFSHKAVVNVILPSQAVEKDIETDAGIGTQTDGSMTIQVATSSVELNDVRATTGKRDVGDKAQGEVTIFNFDDKDKTFSKDTLIQVDNIQFTTNDDVKVAASALTSDASAKLPGKSKIKVTAKDIGPESNLDKGKRFKIDDLSSSTYFAMNDAAFTGGTRKTIKTVSKKDMDDLEASLLTKAKDQQQKELAAKNSQQVTIVDSLTDYELSGEKFSKELGEEGDSLTLKTKVVATYYYFDNSYLNKTLKEELGKGLPDGYELNEKNITYKIAKVTKDKSGIHLNMSAKAKATKAFDTSAALTSIVGKPVTDAKSVLHATYAVTDESINITPQLPPFNTFFPFVKRNIELRVTWE